MKSVMKHQFSEVPQVSIPRSSFDRSHGVKTTFDAGWLVPIFVDEALPGDTFNLDMTGFARLATPIKPIMDNLYMETFFFAVPCRLLWENWKRFMGEQDNPGDSVDYVTPKVQMLAGDSQRASQGLYDYMGIPIYSSGDIQFNALPFRAYNLIWNEWFRDQNLQTSRPLNTGDGPDNSADYVKQRRGKRHDYFTSCLPWPQKGDDGASIPTLGLADVVPAPEPNDVPVFAVGRAGQRQLKGTNSLDDVIWSAPATASGVASWVTTGLQVDLSTASAVTINELRVAFQFQKLLERDARGGTRYTEIIRSHFGVTSPDARQQRPEFLGGGSSRVTIKPVEQTSISGGETPQGNLAAYGTAQLHNHGFTKSFTEHSVIIGLVNVRADLTYQQGMNRMYFRSGKYDYYWPSLAFIGEQSVKNAEIFTESIDFGAVITPYPDPEPTAADPNVFGYQERWAEYRYKPSQITGKFRSDDPLSLDVWHLSQDFESVPLLNGAFIRDDPPIDRVIAAQEEPHFLFDGYFNLRCARPMPLYGVPGNIDRF